MRGAAQAPKPVGTATQPGKSDMRPPPRPPRALPAVMPLLMPPEGIAPAARGAVAWPGSGAESAPGAVPDGRRAPIMLLLGLGPGEAVARWYARAADMAL